MSICGRNGGPRIRTRASASLAQLRGGSVQKRMNQGRRNFVKLCGKAVTLSSATPSLWLSNRADSESPSFQEGTRDRVLRCQAIRETAALANSRIAVPEHRANSDEEVYPHKIGNFHKGLP